MVHLVDLHRTKIQQPNKREKTEINMVWKDVNLFSLNWYESGIDTDFSIKFDSSSYAVNGVELILVLIGFSLDSVIL